MVEDHDNPAITEGIAALAQTYFEMGEDEATARANLLAQWDRLGRPSGVFSASAISMSNLPQPISEPAEKADRMRSIREMLGATSPEASLSAALRGRELLEKLANEFG